MENLVTRHCSMNAQEIQRWTYSSCFHEGRLMQDCVGSVDGGTRVQEELHYAWVVQALFCYVSASMKKVQRDTQTGSKVLS